MSDFAEPFALGIQSAYLGWPAELQEPPLRVICEELLRGTRSIEPAEEEEAVRAVYPGSGFAQLPLWFR